RRHPVGGVFRLEIEAAEEAYGHAWTGRGIGLSALHGVEERLSRVLASPNGSVARGSRLPAHDHGLVRLDERVHRPGCAWLRRGGLAEEIVFFDCRKAGMCVRRSDHAEFVRID